MKKLILLLLFAATAAASVMAQESVDLSMSGPGVKEIKITSKGLTFDIKEIKVKTGDTVRITFTNGGGTHDLIIDEFNVGTEVLRSGKSETIEFKVTQPGEYVYYCSVGKHRELGMWGTLKVVN